MINIKNGRNEKVFHCYNIAQVTRVICGNSSVANSLQKKEPAPAPNQGRESTSVNDF